MTEGRKDGRNDGKPKTMSLRFSSKRRGTIMPVSLYPGEFWGKHHSCSEHPFEVTVVWIEVLQTVWYEYDEALMVVVHKAGDSQT